MSGGPDPTAELRKLAHSLDVDTAELSMVAGVPGEDLRTLRRQIHEALFQADKHYFTRVAALSKAVPGAVAAKLIEVALPPLIAARTAELLEPQRAADMVGRLSDRYLADVSAAMDASRAPKVIAAIPADRVARVGAELARRKEWIVMGSFVAEVSDAALKASIAVLNGEQLLRVGFVLEDLSRLDDIGAMLTDDQIDQMLAAASDFDLWAELTDLLDHLTSERIDRMADRFDVAPDPLQATFRAAAQHGSLAAAALARLGGR